MTTETSRWIYFGDIALPAGETLGLSELNAEVASPIVAPTELAGSFNYSEEISRDELADLLCRC